MQRDKNSYAVRIVTVDFLIYILISLRIDSVAIFRSTRQKSMNEVNCIMSKQCTRHFQYADVGGGKHTIRYYFIHYPNRLYSKQIPIKQ